MKPDGVDKIDKVENEISEERDDDQRLPAISIRYWASKQSEDYPWNTLEHGTVGLKVENYSTYWRWMSKVYLNSWRQLLCFNLSLLMVMNIVTDLHELRLTVQAFLRYNSSPGIPLRAIIRQYMATTGSTVILDNTCLTYSDSFPNMFTPGELTTECPSDRPMYNVHWKLFWSPLGHEYVHSIGTLYYITAS